MAIRNTDKLLVGRGNSSYYVTLENSGLGNDIPLSGTLSGKPITGDIDLDTGVNINIAGDGAGINIKAGYWGALKYDGKLQLEWGGTGIKTGTDINMKAGNTGYTEANSEKQYNNEGGNWADHLHGHGIHWLNAPEHKYDAVNKEYVDTTFIPLTGETKLSGARIVLNAPLPNGKETAIATDKSIYIGESLRFKEGAFIGMDQHPKIKINKWTEIVDVGTSSITQGFTIKGNGRGTDSSLLLKTDHPTSGHDRISYFGLVDTDYSIATKKYVDDAVSSGGGSTDLSGYATESYVDEALENINESGGTQGTGRALGRWSMTFRSPASISSSNYGTIHRTNFDFHVSAKAYSPISGSNDRPDVTEYFSNLSVGDTLYMRKDDGDIEEITLTKVEYDSSSNSYIFAPIPQEYSNGNYYLYDGEGPLGNVPDPSGGFVENMGPGRPVSSQNVITPDEIWGLSSQGTKTSSSPAYGAFFPYAWMKKRYPQMTGFSIAEGIGMSGVYDNNNSPKKIYDPTSLTSGASVKAMIIDGVPGIGVWQSSTVSGNYSIRLYGIQVAFHY